MNKRIPEQRDYLIKKIKSIKCNGCIVTTNYGDELNLADFIFIEDVVKILNECTQDTSCRT